MIFLFVYVQTSYMYSAVTLLFCACLTVHQGQRIYISQWVWKLTVVLVTSPLRAMYGKAVEVVCVCLSVCGCRYKDVLKSAGSKTNDFEWCVSYLPVAITEILWTVKCSIKGSSAANYPAAWRPSAPVGKQSGHVPVTETTFIQYRDLVKGSCEVPPEISIGLVGFTAFFEG